MKKLICILILFVSVSAIAQQLTPDQKRADFLTLAAAFDKEYGPYEWKLALFGVDLLKVQPWLDRVAKNVNALLRRRLSAVIRPGGTP